MDTALTFEDLESLAATLDRGALNTIVRWLAADCTSRTLAVEVEKSTTRIHDLVAAVKRFTYMDRTNAPEAVDLSVEPERLRHAADAQGAQEVGAASA